ncbi:hypothetical protein UlMin_033952 [Ulmus minor]
MEVEIVSRENIKPSSPTPSHLRNFKLSLLDQFTVSGYAPLVLFYPAYDFSLPNRLDTLKKSLSETLTRFYPLAGKIKDDLSIDCDDEGAYFVETRVNCSLRQFLTQPDLLLLNRFLPCEFDFKESYDGTKVTNIQVNVFDCGGIAIGVCISHKILDGAALSTFLKAWSSISMAGSSKEATIFPSFDTISLFPPDDLWLRDEFKMLWDSFLGKGNSVTKRFVFDSSSISTIKARATSSSLQNPTRVEAVSAFIWKYITAASKHKNGKHPRPWLLTHFVNLRKKVTPPLPENSIGNRLWLAAARSSGDRELTELASEVRVGLSKVSVDFVKSMQGEEGRSLMVQRYFDHVGFTSWCRFGFYESDFGWGKPVWVSSIGLSGSVLMRLVILAETRLGDGIEAWLTLDEPEMAFLESQSEITSLVRVDPCPLS